MDWLPLLLDFIVHVDKHLAAFVASYGMWIYVLLFVIIFVETGVVVMPFLPGDSLLFVVGAMCGVGLMDYAGSMALLMTAAVAGNQSNYLIGRHMGSKVFGWEQSRFFDRRTFLQAHDFYERYGGITLIAARFMPFVRTFAPFVAGVAKMSRSKFTFFDVAGAVLWVGGLVTVGFLFGNIPWIKDNLEKIIWATILLPALFVVVGSMRARRNGLNTPHP
jgi:membrane-associated protein